jgi:DNA-binding response OmpR family regulator
VVAVTAYNLPGDELRFLREGFDRYLAKPFAKEQLINLVTELVGADASAAVTRADSGASHRLERAALGRDANRSGAEPPPSPDRTAV